MKIRIKRCDAQNGDRMINAVDQPFFVVERVMKAKARGYVIMFGAYLNRAGEVDHSGQHSGYGDDIITVERT